MEWMCSSSSCGVLIAADAAQEWMIPWWWGCYLQHNHLPVAFVDLGVTDAMKRWCQRHFTYIELPPLPYSASKEHVDDVSKGTWESQAKVYWDKRIQWHKKPAAMLHTPYEHTLWLDTDCEVIAPLDPLFAKMQASSRIWIASELARFQPLNQSYKTYNSGVIGFKKGSHEILAWAEHTIHSHGQFLGDQNLFSYLAHIQKWEVEELDPIYNWRDWDHQDMKSAKIIHWMSDAGKFLISQKILGFYREKR